ncbi:MAG: formate dehydrogenase accessory sulfurtransferase FdhD [Promethearchaeota archaeon]|nr:MAG: formate dehydrogenase accessory sulfurtransferase FdhD [Candidatus Lokiarchaeota archaeon]
MFKRVVDITRFHKNSMEKVNDTILIETPVDIIVNGEPLVNIVCLAKDLKYLGIGFLYSIGIINSFTDIEDLSVDEIDNKIYIQLKKNIEVDLDLLQNNPVSRVIDTSCGISSPWRAIIKKSLDNQNLRYQKNENLNVNAEIISKAVLEMQKSTPLFKETGGCHGAAIFKQTGNLIAVLEDIGRHNAIDKIIGYALSKNIDMSHIFLTTTGRLTGDSVLKAIRANIPILASLSAAIESGVRLAFGYGLTLIGFVRGKKMNIYTHSHRVHV